MVMAQRWYARQSLTGRVGSDTELMHNVGVNSPICDESGVIVGLRTATTSSLSTGPRRRAAAADIQIVPLAHRLVT